MKQSLFTGMAIGAALAGFAGTYAYVNKPAQTPAVQQQATPPAKSEPFNDCVHSAFPQCSDNQNK